MKLLCELLCSRSATATPRSPHVFTIYRTDTRQKFRTITARTPEIAYRRAEAICRRGDRHDRRFQFDDTCAHGTAYDICKRSH